jgi:CheY-like chemotaxis protein
MDREIRTVLIIDDSTSILFYLGMLLRRLEYNVVTAQNAEDAMQIMEQFVPSIVLTDIFLAAMSGIDLMKRINDTPLWKTIPIVVMTNENDSEIKDACMRLGCVAYLSKPVEPDVLYRTLQSVSDEGKHSSPYVAQGDRGGWDGDGRHCKDGVCHCDIRRRSRCQNALSAAAECPHSYQHIYLQ